MAGAAALRQALAAQCFDPGAAALLVVRPEALAVGEAPASAFAWDGRVVDNAFRGARRSLSIETATGLLKSGVTASAAPTQGDGVRASMRSGGDWLLAAAPAVSDT